MACFGNLRKHYFVYVSNVTADRFGKSTHISIIRNSVTHLRSYTNSSIADIAGNSAPISLEIAKTKSVVQPDVLYALLVLTWTRLETRTATNRESGMAIGVGGTQIYSGGCITG